jgi:acyl-CoA synthetase (AMP-forming)/AMP-acid ligase II
VILLREHEVHQQPALLASAWANPPTFALLPEKLSVSDDWLAQSLALVPQELHRDHFIMLTSGTTGLPKLIIGNRARSEKLAQVLHDRQDSEPVKETISMLPLSYTYSFVNQWLWSHVMHRRFITTHGLADPKSLKVSLKAARDAMICLVGVQVPLLMTHLAGECFEGVTRVHFAGGRFPQEKLNDLRAMFPSAQTFNNYGCAEAMPRLTIRGAEEAGEAANIGRPLCGIEMRSDDQHSILFRSPYGAVGVVESMKFTTITPDDWIPSGDLGEMNDDGSWRLLGRASEVFKRHGEKVSLAALTTTVSAAWSGQCAFYREADRTGEDGCVLVLAPEGTSESVKPVLMALRKHHPRAQWPLRIESVTTLPLLSSGKADVRALPSLPHKTTLWQQHI